MLTTDKLQRNRELREAFIEDRPILPGFRNDDQSVQPFGYIYCIENKTNHKKYIGSTYSVWTGIQHPSPRHQLRKRAAQYLYEYNKVCETQDTSAAQFNRPILKAMVAEGFENFVMYPIAETTIANHYDKEAAFIQLYDTVNNGYNVLNADGGYKRPGKRMSEAGKKSRSEPVVCFNLNQKKIIFADSMKLFADYMDSTKDMIKNCVRGGLPYKGWFIFYTNGDKRIQILQSVLHSKTEQTNRQRSEKAIKFYDELCTMVGLYLQDRSNEYFGDFELLPSLEYSVSDISDEE